MIAIISSKKEESAAFGALCESRHWVWNDGDSVKAFQGLLRLGPPKVILTRHKLSDGYSDDILSLLAERRLLPGIRVLILADASLSSAREARQIELGADHVHRDPIRIEVLFAYLAKYRAAAAGPAAAKPTAAPRSLRLAGALIDPVERTARHRNKQISLTPREVELAELLASSNGEVVTYPTLYSEILGRRFRGETSNLRVLLGKLGASLATIGSDLRTAIKVIPKTGYRVRAI